MPFDQIAGFYDDLMASVPYDAWIEYVHLVCAYAGLRPRSVLDVCCGTGTMAEAFAQGGLETVGVDLSAPMVEVARQKGLAEYFVADVRSFRLGREFDLAYSFFDSLNYVATLDGLREALDSVARHVVPGGAFLFDLNTGYAFEQRMFDQQERSARAAVKYRWRGEYDPVTRLIEVHMDFRHGGRTVTETHVQRAHSDEEVRQGLADAGFVGVECFDGFSLNPPTRRSDRVHYLARRG